MTDLYLVQEAKGQWWHYVAALKTADGREFGVQATRFRFNQGAMGQVQRFNHCALTDVQGQKHLRLEDYDNTAVITRMNCSWTSKHRVLFEVEGIKVDLSFEPVSKPQYYESETSTHWGHMRMPVTGTIGGVPVSGVGCFDREIFEKLLKPGEHGWIWEVKWWDDGKTEMNYNVIRNAGYQTWLSRTRLGEWTGGFYDSTSEWPVNEHRNFAYSEELLNIEREGVTGRMFREMVGYDGSPEL